MSKEGLYIVPLRTHAELERFRTLIVRKGRSWLPSCWVSDHAHRFFTLKECVYAQTCLRPSCARPASCDYTTGKESLPKGVPVLNSLRHFEALFKAHLAEKVSSPPSLPKYEMSLDDFDIPW